MELGSGFQLDTTKGYTIKVVGGSEPRHLIDSRDNTVVKSILSSMARACDSDADVRFMLDKVQMDEPKIEVYSVDMYVEMNTDVLLDQLNAIMAAYPSRIHRSARIRTARRPDVNHLYATRVHIDITTHDFALIPSRIDVCHIYSPAIPLKRNAVTGVFAKISNASTALRNDPKQFRSPPSESARTSGGSWTDTFGSLFSRSSASTPAPVPRKPNNFIVVRNRPKNTRPFKRSRMQMEEPGKTDDQ